MQSSIRSYVSRLSFLAGVILAVWSVATANQPALGAQPEPIKWREGRDVQRQLEQITTITWAGTSVRAALTQLSQSQGIAVLLDRRINPSQTIALTVSDQKLEQVFAEIAEHLNAGYAQLGPVAYIGPLQRARYLQTLAMVQRQPFPESHPLHAALMQRAAWNWPTLTTPHELFAQLQQQLGDSIAGQDAVPHDLWAEASLPPLSLAERITLVAVQFDLMFLPDEQGSGLLLQPVPEELHLEHSFPAGSHGAQLISAIGDQIPGLKAELKGNRILASGRWEDLQLLATALKRPNARNDMQASSGTPRLGRQVHTLRLSNARLDQVLERLKDLGLEFELDQPAIEEANIRLDTLINVEVKDATLDRLLKTILEPVGLEFQRQGSVVRIRPNRSTLSEELPESKKP